jgi:predicted GIY-YIG superfamily endonuclease
VRVRYRGEYQQDTSETTGSLFNKSKSAFSIENMAFVGRKQRNSNRRPVQPSTSTWRLLHWKWNQLKHFIRRLIHRTTVYVLLLDNGKYYVGSTVNPKRRFQEHFGKRSLGSRWTRTHRPIRVEAQIRRVPHRFLVGVEAQVTAEYMLKYGVNNVRGAYFTHPRNYTLDDISILTGFLGHYGNLDFKMLEKKLRQTLPPPSPAAIRRSFQRRRMNLPLMSNNLLESRMAALRNARSQSGTTIQSTDVCYNCGRVGHWAKQCPDRKDGDELFLQSVLKGRISPTETNNMNDEPSAP